MIQSLIALTVFLSFAEAKPKVSLPKGPFAFDATSGRCLNDKGETGLNKFVPKQLFHGINSQARNQRWLSRNAQCIDFSKVRFHDYLGANYGTPVAWDFRGSLFDGANLSFNFIEMGLFKGSSIELISVGYGRVTAADLAFDKGDMPMPQFSQ